jgi:hypothetical protein
VRGRIRHNHHAQAILQRVAVDRNLQSVHS